MKNITAICLTITVAMTVTACGRGEHFLTDREYRERVHADFTLRKQLAAGRAGELFGVFDGRELSTQQREALEFLYAYMPLCDLSEYDGDYFLSVVDGAFRARDHFPWGKSVPEDIFRHFVLVHRVNNEYMDGARDVFFGELKDRLEGMSMYDAALEVNHWCHEKVTYRGTDARTSAPLALMRTSWGRCGEESTFTTAALRAVGIPARQSYTPRWVHTDSNHAWVEVWIDGRWYYMGACEPESELNAAWFDGPVQRAMMTHTTVYGHYDGPEQKNRETPLYSIINTLNNYAPTRPAAVRVVDTQGSPVGDARVRFKVYNGADLSTIVTLVSDSNGSVEISTGCGDILVWADKDGAYGYAKSNASGEPLTVVLDRRRGDEYTGDLVMLAPPERPFDELPAAKLAENAARLSREDSIRGAYMATFPGRDYAFALADRIRLDRDTVWTIINNSQGNWCEMEAFLTDNAADERLLRFAMTLTDKDMRDTPASYLTAHLSDPFASANASDMEIDYVLSPRIGQELITPWRAKLYEDVFENDPDMLHPQAIAGYVTERIAVSDKDNYYNCRQTPLGVHTLRVSEALSRDIYFVALCRAASIPARLEPASGKPQYFAQGKWHDVMFDDGEVSSQIAATGQIRIFNDASNVIPPGYGSHFSLARFTDGDFRVLDLGSIFTADVMRRADRTPVTLTLEEGYYRLLTSSRANDGSAAVRTEYFNLAPGGDRDLTLRLPRVESKLFVKGVVDMNSVIVTDDGRPTTLKQLSGGKGALLIFADPDREPTKHILQEMPEFTAALERWGGAVIFMVPDDKRTEGFDRARFPGQPSQTVWATDTDRQLLGAATSAIRSDFRNNFPLVLYLTNNGGVIFSSEGYRIGIISDIIHTIKKEEQSKE